jgi:hypothetical protein
VSEETCQPAKRLSGSSRGHDAAPHASAVHRMAGLRCRQCLAPYYFFTKKMKNRTQGHIFLLFFDKKESFSLFFAAPRA